MQDLNITNLDIKSSKLVDKSVPKIVLGRNTFEIKINDWHWYRKVAIDL